MTARLLLGLLLLPALSSGEAVAAAHNCKCLYKGKRFEQGELVCIRVDGVTRLARCDMLLNNSSWTFLAKGCPNARYSPVPEPIVPVLFRVD